MPSITNKEIGPVGYGLMGLTLRSEAIPHEQAFKAMRAAIKVGANCWNGGQIYGPLTNNSLHLLNAYFTQYPEDAEKVVLSIKGGLPQGIRGGPDGSEDGIRWSIEDCLKVLDGKKFLDLFEMARVDPKVPIETSIAAIDKYVQAGKIGGISLSEVSADTIRRAAKVAKISAVEVEFSLWTTDILENGIAQACAELDIPILAYSPIGRGFLTGELKKPEDLAEDDFRRTIPRFQGEAFYENLKLVEQVKRIAGKKGVTPAQIGLGWIRTQSGKDGMPTIIPIPGASSDARVIENSKDVTLTDAEMDEISQILKTFVPTGDRYHAHGMSLVNG